MVAGEINLKIIMSEEYPDFLNVFLNKNLDILSCQQTYNHKIVLNDKEKHIYLSLYKMSP